MSTKLIVSINRYMESSVDEGGRYGYYRHEYRNEFKSAVIAKKDKIGNFTTSLDLHKNQTIFVVWAEWSTGDSFGSDINSQTEVLGVFLDKGAALELESFLNIATQLRADISKWNLSKFKGQSYQIKQTSRNLTQGVKLITSDKQEFSFFYMLPRRGYFEKLTAVHISEAKL